MPASSEDQRQESDHDSQTNEKDDADCATEYFEHDDFLFKRVEKYAECSHHQARV
jgi:hypothetical protein